MGKATLLLSDGSRYVGRAFGAPGRAEGDLAFHTGVIDCIETLTSPVCAGKLVVFTFPDVGGHGVIPSAFYSDTIHAAGVIVRGWADHPSNWQSTGDLDGLLREQGIPGICGIDTRALMIRLRESGPLSALLYEGDALDAPEAPPRRIFPLPETTLHLEGKGPRIAVIDMGLGGELARKLHARGADVTLLGIRGGISGDFDGYAFSDGPEERALQADIPVLPEGKPLFGEGAGHILIARARGGAVSRMRAQHGGANLPVRWGEKVYITAQFHAHGVTSVPQGAVDVFRNLNDDTVEGIVYRDAITVQFPLGTEKGPHDMGFLYDRFLSMAGA